MPVNDIRALYGLASLTGRQSPTFESRACHATYLAASKSAAMSTCDVDGDGAAMTGKPTGRKALTPTQRQQRWRLKKRREAKGAEKRDRREARLTAMAERTERARRALHGIVAIYNVVVIDPGWPFAVRSRVTGLDRSHENHYQSMTLEQIEALRIPAAPDCVLALWVTGPAMPHGYRILALWGFTYVTTITWNKRTKDMAKVKRGLGYAARNTTEYLIIGKRGNPPWAIPGEQWDSAFDAPATEHSVKPDDPYSFLEEQFRGASKLEMFARRARAGWDTWGNEVGEGARYRNDAPA
jgi:N6-adenosine-specific RNA methylase IME4